MEQTDNVSKLSWILDFAQMKWEALSKEQKDIINVRLGHLYNIIFQPTLEPEDYETFSEEEMIGIQTQVKGFFDKLFGIPGSDRSGQIYCDLPPIGRALIVFDGHYQICRLPADLYNVAEEMKSFRMPREEAFARAIIDYAAETVNFLSEDLIKKCAECQKLFLHISKKKKIFCSTKCSYKFLSRERRRDLEKHPRKYKAFLKKQRETMRKYYKKRRKAGSGGKVTRRKEV